MQNRETCKELPKVSIVMPVLNEEDSLLTALESLIDNSYPLSKIEIILVDGGSNDGTIDLIESLISLDKFDIKLLHNAKKHTPISLNIGIRGAANSIILRADAHAYYHDDYILNSVQGLLSGAGDNVGGNTISRASSSDFSYVLALILNSIIGNGGASYRNKKSKGEVDTIWCGCWYKATLIEIGLFDESWHTNQDAELNGRLRRNGKVVFFDPSIVAELEVRSSLEGMIKQYFNYGRGRFKTLLRYPELIKLRQVLPVLFFFIFIFLVFSNVIVPTFVMALCVVTYFLEKDVLRCKYLWGPAIVVGMNCFWALGFLFAGVNALYIRCLSVGN